MQTLQLNIKDEKIDQNDNPSLMVAANKQPNPYQTSKKLKNKHESGFRKYCINKLLNSSKVQIRLRQSASGICVYFDTQKFSYDCFQNLLSLLEGKQISVQRDVQLIMFIKAAQIFGLKQLQAFIQNDILINRDLYNIFSLFLISQKCQIDWLNTICLGQLIKYNFQQFSYNLYDLIQCDRQSFQCILSIHQSYVRGKICKGQPNDVIKQTVKMYCQANCTIVDAEKFMINQLQIIPEENQDSVDNEVQLKDNHVASIV